MKTAMLVGCSCVWMCGAGIVTASQDPPPAPVEHVGERVHFGQWMMEYYLHPEPDAVGERLREILEEGTLESRSGFAASFVGFFCEVFKQNPDRAQEWAMMADSSPARAREMFARAASGAQFEGFDEVVRSLLRDDDQHELRDRLVTQKPGEVKDTPLRSPATLDALWGGFFATGESKYVARIVDALAEGRSVERPDEESEDMSDVMLAGAARWSLKSLSKQQARVREICAELAASHPHPHVRAELKKILEAEAADEQDAP